MQATAAITTIQRGQGQGARARALVRFNGLAFCSLAAASFLETAVARQVSRLAPVFAAHPGVPLWLDQVWGAGRAAIGRQLREYVETTWPEFDWKAAYCEYHDRQRPGFGLRGVPATVAHQALGLCVASAQAAVFYRALARSADEPALRDLARDAARAHAAYFDFFRDLLDRCKRVERVGITATWRTAIAVSRAARDDDVAAAFEPLDRNWNGASVVPAFGYPEYRLRMAQFVQRHAALGAIERLLFRPWLERERAARVPQVPVPRIGRSPAFAAPGCAA
jgi:hypothetical protein